MTRAWIGVVSRAHVRRGVAGGFAQMCHGRKAPLARMSVGDWLVYYSPTTEFRGGDPLKAFTAIGRVLDGEVFAVDLGGGFVPFRRRIAYVPTCREVAVHTLAPELRFIRQTPSWGLLARRGHFEVGLPDVELIARAMGTEPARRE